MFLGGWLERKIGPRFSTLIGGWIMSAGVLLSYFTIKISFWLLLLTYGVMFGVGVGIAYVVPLSCAMRWMPRWKGVVSGFIVAGFGLGALIFDQLQTQYINPHNINAIDGYFIHREVLDRVPIIYLILGTTYAIMQFLGALLLSNPPDNDSLTNCDEGNKRNEENYEMESEITESHKIPSTECDDQSSEDDKFNDKSTSSLQNLLPSRKNTSSPITEETCSQQMLSLPSFSSSPPPVDNHSMHPLQILKLFGFYHLWSMMLLAAFSVNFIATFFKVYGLTFISDDHFLSVVGSISAIFNSLGRIVWGLVVDKISFQTGFILRSVIMTAFLLTFYATSAVEFAKPMFLIWVCVIFFCVGGIYSMFPAVAAHNFGEKYMSINYGFLFSSQVATGVASALIFPIVLKYLQWRGLIFLVSGLSAADLVLTLLYWRKN